MTFSQDRWYQQRYGNAQRQRQQRLNFERKKNKFDQIKADQETKRDTFLSHAEVIFVEHDISYEVRGHSWLCTVGHEAIYYWPKSGKWREKGQAQIWSSRGAQDFLDKVYSWQRQQGG